MQAVYSKKSQKIHETVLLKEVTEYLSPLPGQKFIDATLGTGGHALELVNLGASVLGIDLDPGMIAIAESRLKSAKKGTFTPIRGNFRNIDKIAEDAGFDKVAGVILDLGVSNLHLKDEERGFSFANPEASLDMRIDPDSQGVTASNLLGVLRQDQLRELFAITMEPGSAVWLSRRVIGAREIRPILTVGDFAQVVRGLRAKPGLNALTLPMLALRIAVNSEIENLKEVLPKAFELLERGGRLAVISFHSGEDKEVKNFFKGLGAREQAYILTSDPVVPKEIEIENNPRARSAKLRVCEKN